MRSSESALDSDVARDSSLLEARAHDAVGERVEPEVAPLEATHRDLEHALVGRIAERVVPPRVVTAAFVLGLLGAPLAYLLFARLPVPRIDAGYAALIAAGLLVGVGTRYGSGCTSGHGVCGLARLSPRSLAATACFMASGFATVFVIRHLFNL